MPDVFVSEMNNIKPKKEDNLEVKPSELLNKQEIPPFVHDLSTHSHNPLSAYCYFPDHVKFIAKDTEEKIVLVLRRHPITNIKWILIALIMFASPMLLSSFPLLAFMPDNFQFIAVLFWYMLSIAFVFESFLDWFFSVFIVTDERMFDVDFVNLIYREISEANIDQIQDVTVKMGGVVRTIFNYGDIMIQTASEVPNIEFEAVPHPDQVAKVLRELRVEEEKEKLEGRVR